MAQQEIELLTRLARLEEYVQEAQSTIKKICQWIQSKNDGVIIVPNYLVDSEPESRIFYSTKSSSPISAANKSTKIKIDLTEDEEVKIKGDSDGEDKELGSAEDFQFEANFNSDLVDHDVNPFESESEPDPEEPIINVKENLRSKPCTTTSSSSNSIRVCRPCIVLLPPRLDTGKHQLKLQSPKKRKLFSSGFHTSTKVQPTEQEKDLAIRLCQDRSHINRVFIFCPICPQRFSGSSKKGLFKTHLVKMHYFTKEDLEKCKFLDKHPKSYIAHIEASTKIKKSKSKNASKYNVKDNHHLCITCGKIFHSKYFKMHNIKMHSGIEPSFACIICQASFHFETDLNKHMKNHHCEEKNHLCPKCGKAFKRLYSLQCHLLTHSQDRLYKCSENGCDSTFKQYQALLGHRRRVHLIGGLVKNHMCDKCDMTFLYQNELKRHVEGVHDHQRPHPCHICSKSFKCRTNLKYHIRTHSNPNSKYRGYNKPK